MIPKTETAFITEGKSDRLQSPYSNSLSFTVQTEERYRAMINQHKDTAGNVIERLAVLNQMFEFYQYTHEMANFRPETIPGLCIVIDDCIDALKTIV